VLSSPAVVRIKANFRSIKILPVGLYKPLVDVCIYFIDHAIFGQIVTYCSSDVASIVGESVQR